METDTHLLITSLAPVNEFLPLTTGSIIAIISAVLLLVFSTLLSAAEIAYFSMKSSDLAEIKKQDGISCKTTVKHLERPEQLYYTIIISRTFAYIGFIILAVYIVRSLMVASTPCLGILFITGLISILLLLLSGEILPKIYAAGKAQKAATFMAIPLSVCRIVLLPFVLISIKSTDLINKRLALKLKGLSLDDISHALDLDDDSMSEGKELLKGIVNFGNIDAAEIMTARVDVIDIDIKSELSKVVSEIVESGYSRMPVYEDGPDDVKGILYIKDLLPHIDKDDSFEWQSLIRPAYYVPETKRINDLLQEFKTQKIHMAVVVDEYGGTSGIVTLEDVLEEIVGDISDELDDEEITFSKLPDGNYVFDGKTLLKDFFRITEVPEESFSSLTDEPETLAGLILELKGAIPSKHEVIEHSAYRFTILAADSRRIKKIKFARK